MVWCCVVRGYGFIVALLRNKERFLATRCCGSVGGSSWLYFTRQDCTYRHIYLYIGLIVVSLSLFFSALSLPACSSTEEESCVYKKLRAYDPHEGQGPLHGWFTRFDVATSFTIISRQSCLQERDISQIRIRKGKNDQGQQEQQQDLHQQQQQKTTSFICWEAYFLPFKYMVTFQVILILP